MKKRFISFLMGISLVFVSYSASATVVKPVNLETLSDLAEQIFKAKVVSKDVQLDEYESGKMVVYYTLQVSDVIKGDVGEEVVFKQLADGEYLTDTGIVVRQKLFFPEYEVGQTYLFFMPDAHEATGLKAPIGLFQGVFKVKTDNNGKEYLPELQERARFLKKDLPSNTTRFLGLEKKRLEDDQSYESFKDMIRSAM